MKINALDWTKGEGLIPVIVQHHLTGQVLMLAFMNERALQKTIETGQVTFWSRSRQSLWTKGETSGNLLTLKEIRQDCDGDTLLVLVDPAGPACHRGTVSCFDRESREFGTAGFLTSLEELIHDRHCRRPEGSYTTSLFQQGISRIAKKLGEEAIEVLLSANEDTRRTVEESADLLYHLLVFLTARGISLSTIVEELKLRHGERA